MNNFDHAMEATDTAINSTGSAAKENEAYMGGLEAKTTALKASYEKFSQKVVDSKLVKGLLDAGVAIMNGLSTPMGVAATQTTLATGALVGLGGILKMGGITDKLKEVGPALSSFIKDTGNIMLGTPIEKLGDVFKYAGGGIQDFIYTITKGKVFPSMGAVGLGIAGVTAGIVGLTVAVDKMYSGYDDAVDKVNELTEARDAEFGAGTRYDQLVSNQAQLNALEQQELDFLQQKLDLKNQMIKQAQEEAFKEYQELYGTGREVKIDGPYGESMTMAESNFAGLIRDVGEFNQKLQDGTMDASEFHNELGSLIDRQMEAVEPLREFKEQGFELDDAQERQIALVDSLLDVYSQGLPVVEEFGVAAYETLTAAGMSAEDARAKSIELMEGLAEEMEKSGTSADQAVTSAGATADAIAAKDYTLQFEAKLPESYPEPPVLHGTIAYTPSFSGTGVPGSYQAGAGHAEGTDNAPGGPTLVNELGPELISANGKAYIAGGGEPSITNLPKGAIVLNAEETKKAMSGMGTSNKIPAYAMGSYSSSHVFAGRPKYDYGAVIDKHTGHSTPSYKPSTPTKPSGQVPSYTPNQSDIKGNMGAGSFQDAMKDPAFRDYYNRLPKYPPRHGGGGGGGGGGGSSGPSAPDLKAQSKEFKEQIRILEHKLFLMEKEEKTEAERIDQMKKIQEEIEKQKQWYYDHGEDENSKYIQDLEKQWWKYEDKIKKLYKEQAKIYDQLFGAVSDKAQGEIDALEKKKQAIQDQNSEMQKQLDLEKALDELARARQQKVLVFKDGKMQYVEDADAVSKAQARVDEIKNRDAVDKQIADIDKQIEEWEKYKEAWDSVVKDYDKKQDLLLLKEKLGIDLEADNWKERLENLQVYIDKYNELMVKGGAKDADLKARSYSLGETGPAIATASVGLTDTGAPTPASMLSSFNNGVKSLGQSIGITIQNFAPNLSNVTDGEGFVNYLKNNFLGEVLRVAEV